MGNKLKVSKKFVPCSIDDNDEIYPNGFFNFNITKLLQFIKEDNGKTVLLEEVDVQKTLSGFAVLTAEHIDTVDVTKPIILAEISPGRFTVIDGNHRLEKASRLKMEKIWAYRIGPDLHTKFLTSKKAYKTYIGYWNGKLAELKAIESMNRET